MSYYYHWKGVVNVFVKIIYCDGTSVFQPEHHWHFDSETEVLSLVVVCVSFTHVWAPDHRPFPSTIYSHETSIRDLPLSIGFGKYGKRLDLETLY